MKTRNWIAGAGMGWGWGGGVEEERVDQADRQRLGVFIFPAYLSHSSINPLKSAPQTYVIHQTEISLGNALPSFDCSASLPPRWPSGKGVRLESGRSRVQIPLAPGFFRGRVIPVT